jgi:molybdopterin-guanine dinucleotide biosynthesis protein A
MDTQVKDCTGIILAGGENTRMPVRKGFIQVNGKTLKHHCWVISMTLGAP